ncbi:unnamed protein product, partial [Adineta steineri]
MTYRLYTRTQDFESLGQCFISFDLTEFDFRSNPPLSYYVKYWFIDIDDLIDCLASKFNQRITLIISDLVMHITYDILRPIFPQIIQVIIIGKPSHRYENVKYFPDAQLLVDHLSSVVRDRQRVYITFDSWPVERTSYDLNKHTAKYL